MLARSMFQNPQRNVSFLWKQGTWIGLNPTRLLPPSMGRISRDSGAASSMPPVAVHRQNDDFPGDLRFEQRDNKDMDTVWIQWIAWILVLQYGTMLQWNDEVQIAAHRALRSCCKTQLHPWDDLRCWVRCTHKSGVRSFGFTQIASMVRIKWVATWPTVVGSVVEGPQRSTEFQSSWAKWKANESNI